MIAHKLSNCASCAGQPIFPQRPGFAALPPADPHTRRQALLAGLGVNSDGSKEFIPDVPVPPRVERYNAGEPPSSGRQSARVSGYGP
jgi:hypothetical protein